MKRACSFTSAVIRYASALGAITVADGGEELTRAEFAVGMEGREMLDVDAKEEVHGGGGEGAE